jgi:hypothetical protein
MGNGADGSFSFEMVVTLNADFEYESVLYGQIREQLVAGEAAVQSRKRSLFVSTLDRYRVCTADVSNGNLHPGDVVMDLIFTWLSKLYRSPQQKDFHMAFLGACLRIVYGAAYTKERHRIMVKYQFDSKKQQVLVCAPRRLGKTYATALFAIVMAIVLPGIEISIFSPGQRQSVALMGHIYTFMKRLGETGRVITKNVEKMVLRSIGGQHSKINAYPSAVKTLKGVSGSIVLLEELAVIDPAVLYEVVCPLHQLDDTAFIGISTITTSDNFMTRYLSMKDKNGELLFAVKQIYLACKVCRDAGMAHKCHHNVHMLPMWSSARKRRIVDCIMTGQEEMNARELGGVASELNQKAFLGKQVTMAEERQRYSVNRAYDYPCIFIAVDPNGAGKSSDIAITTLLRFQGEYVLIGLETFQSKSALENHSLLVRHVKALEQTGLYQNALKVFILESNLGLESEHISHMLRDNISNYLVMSEKPEGGKIGFCTTNAMKTLAVEQLRERLGDGAFRVAEEACMVSISHTYNEIVGIMFEQMREFSEVLRESAVEKPKKYYSGKNSGKDDLIIAVLLAITWSGYFFKSEKYAHYQ